MKISDKTNLTGTQRRKLSLGLLTLLFFGGVIAGTIMVCMAENVETLSGIIFTQKLLKTSETTTVLKFFLNDFLPLSAALFFLFLLGFFSFGQPLAVLTVFYRGTAVGITASFYYLMLGIKGILAILILLFPFAAASGAVLIFGTRESVKYSNSFISYMLKKNSDAKKSESIKIYAVKFAVLALFCLLISAVDCITACFFTGLIF